MTEPILTVDHLTKRYTGDLRRSLRYALHDIGRELLRRPPDGARSGEFPALDDISFALSPGEALAVVGPNGAGKSTLLKVLYGLVKPDGGEVRIRGRVGGLIELGTGFDPVLTGRENIAVNAAVLGLSPGELAEATEEVLAFAELEDAADTPVRYYSSGMSARLAFAVAAHLRPDVLLVDEVLAVGDFAFQRKCVQHMHRFLDGGGALILVSHNVFLVQTLCSRGLLLDGGRCVFEGTSAEVVTRYLATRQPKGAAPEPVATGAAGPVAVEAVEVTAPGGAPRTGEPLTVTLRYRCAEPVSAAWGFSIWTGDQWVCVTGDYDVRPRRLEGEGVLSATVPSLPLLPGAYVVRAALIDAETWHPFAISGLDSLPPVLITVEASGGALGNAMTAIQQLVTVDVDWD